MNGYEDINNNKYTRTTRRTVSTTSTEHKNVPSFRQKLTGQHTKLTHSRQELTSSLANDGGWNIGGWVTDAENARNIG